MTTDGKKEASVMQHCQRCGSDARNGKEGFCKSCVTLINREFEKYRKQQIAALRRDMRL